jgi:uncharacterized OB-fold protein
MHHVRILVDTNKYPEPCAILVYLKASKCHCGKASMPPKSKCPLCGKLMDSTEIVNRGKVLSFTTLFVAPEGFTPPLKVAMVELEDGPKVFCNFEKEVAIDTKVEIFLEGDRFKIKS